MYNLTKRLFDLLLSLFLLIFFSPVFLVLYLVLKFTNDKGPVIHNSKRVGINNSIFLMPKFRSMKMNTPQVATHLLSSPDQYLTRLGPFLRKSSLDELPQLISIFKGDMSFVGPRPALFNQDDLMALRNNHGIEKLKPGLTGWAQINGRDEIPIVDKVALEKFYLENRSLFFDIKILFLTFFKVLKQESVTH